MGELCPQGGSPRLSSPSYWSPPLSKVTLLTFGSDLQSKQNLNANSTTITAAFDNTLSRDGTGPNQMTAQLDMNSNRVINLGTPVSGADAVTKAYVDALPLTAVVASGNFPTVSSLSALRALYPVSTVLSNGFTVYAQGYGTANDLGGGYFQYISADTTALDDDCYSVVDAQNRRWRRQLQNGLLLVEMGGAFVSTTDNATALRKVLKSAYTWKIGKIGFSGQYRFATPLHQNLSGTAGEDFSIPSGVEWVGLGQVNMDAFFLTTEPGLQYTGTTSACDLRNPLGTSVVGNYAFRNLKFNNTVAAVDWFRFNKLTLAGATYTPTNDASTPKFMQGINFYGCAALGQHGPGDFIQACKTFELNIDDASLIREWRRGVNLDGCDRCRVYARLELNGRHVHITSTNTFGNSNLIDCRQFSTTDVNSVSENKYGVFDEGRGTDIYPGLVEDSNSRAAFWINGLHCTIHSPFWGSTVPIFELGPAALGCRILSPKGLVGGITVPIINAPGSWNLGITSQDYRLYIIDADIYTQNATGNNPRLCYMAAEQSTYNQYSAATPILLSGGPKNAHIYADSGQYFNFVQDSVGVGVTNNGISGVSTYTGTRTGYALELAVPSGNSYAAIMKLTCGIDFQNGDNITWGSRIRESAGGSSGTIDYRIGKNAGSVATGSFTATTSFANKRVAYTTAGFVNGDVLYLCIFNNRNVMIQVECFDVLITTDPIADLGVSTIAVLADVQTYINSTLVPYINKYLGTIRTSA